MNSGYRNFAGKAVLVTAIVVLMAFFRGFAADNQVVIAKANRAYNSGQYQEAISAYTSLISEGWESPDLYYNIGNSYFKLNDIPHAILWYERARRIDPGNEDVNFNLNVANSRITDRIEPLPEMFYRRWITSLMDQFPADSWARFGIALLVISLLLIFVYISSRVLIIRKICFWTGMTSLLVSFLFLFFAWGSYRSIQSDLSGIIISPTITVKSSPDEKSTDIFVLHEGSKVQLIDRIGTWYEIRIANGSVGWVQQNSLEQI